MIDIVRAAGGTLVDDPFAAQFAHRVGALVCVPVLILLSATLWRSRALPAPLALLPGALVLVQFALGVATLTGGMVHAMAVSHQAVGLVMTALLAALVAWPSEGEQESTNAS